MDQPPILICYDGSAGADEAIAAAAGLLGNRRAVVVNVASPLTVSESFAALGSPGPADFEELNEKSALERASAGAEIARKAGFDAAAHPEVGAPTWETIVELADELDAAAIVIGSRGLSGAKELLKGSLSHEVAEHADRPVLIVPPARPRQ